MEGIYHKVGIHGQPADILKALTTQQGLAGWWTTEVAGDFKGGTSTAGDSIRFTFGHKGGFDMKVVAAEQDRVAWECTAGPEDWIGSHIDFDLRNTTTEDSKTMTLVFFRHRDWKTISEFTAHCSTKWAVFLLSLKSLVETGRGQPSPDDIKIDDWN